jgi:hypothetical protein
MFQRGTLSDTLYDIAGVGAPTADFLPSDPSTLWLCERRRTAAIGGQRPSLPLVLRQARDSQAPACGRAQAWRDERSTVSGFEGKIYLPPLRSSATSVRAG